MILFLSEREIIAQLKFKLHAQPKVNINTIDNTANWCNYNLCSNLDCSFYMSHDLYQKC